MSRRFQIWEYTVSHQQLLLRSSPTDSAPTRVDVLFKGVSFIRLPTSLIVEEFVEASADEVLSIGGEPARRAMTDDRRGFRLRSPDGDGLIVAAVKVSAEDSADSGAPSSLPVWPMRADASLLSVPLATVSRALTDDPRSAVLAMHREGLTMEAAALVAARVEPTQRPDWVDQILGAASGFVPHEAELQRVRELSRDDRRWRESAPMLDEIRALTSAAVETDDVDAQPSLFLLENAAKVIAIAAGHPFDAESGTLFAACVLDLVTRSGDDDLERRVWGAMWPGP